MENEQLQRDMQALASIAAQTASEVVVKVAAAAAEQVALTASHAALALSETTRIDLQYIKDDLKEIKVRLDNKYVTMECFKPIRALVYGQVALILITVVGAIVAMVLKKL